MKKYIALLVSALMILGIFAGCGNTASGGETVTTTAPVSGADDIVTPETAGTLLVNAAATMTITYGTDGLVLEVEGINDDAIELIGTYEDLLGSSCAEVVSQFIKDCVVRNYMFDTNHVVIKQNKGSALPGTNFLESIKTAAEAALKTVESDAVLVMITEENLDENGYIDLVTAKVLVEAFLEVDAVDGFDGTDKPVDGVYAFDVVYDQMQENIIVNAETGGVSQGVIDELERDPEEQEGYTEETSPAEGSLAEATDPADDIVEEPTEDTVAAD